MQFFPEKPFKKPGDVLLSISMEGRNTVLEKKDYEYPVECTASEMVSSSTTSATTSSSASGSSSPSFIEPLAVTFNPAEQADEKNLLSMVQSIIGELSKDPLDKRIIRLLNTTHLHRWNIAPRIWRKGDTLESVEKRATEISKLYWEEWQVQHPAVVRLLKDFSASRSRGQDWVLDWQNLTKEPTFGKCYNKIASWVTAKRKDLTKFRKNLGDIKQQFTIRLTADPDLQMRGRIKNNIITWENIHSCYQLYNLEECAVHVFLRGGKVKELKIGYEVYPGILGTLVYTARERISGIYSDVQLSNQPNDPYNDLVDIGTAEELKERDAKRVGLIANIIKRPSSGRESPASTGVTSSLTNSSSVSDEEQEDPVIELTSGSGHKGQSGIERRSSLSSNSSMASEGGKQEVSTVSQHGFFGTRNKTPSPLPQQQPVAEIDGLKIFDSETAVRLGLLLAEQHKITTKSPKSKSVSPPASPEKPENRPPNNARPKSN